jgi:5-methylcytosine-specific restriction endonuclease McrA
MSFDSKQYYLKNRAARLSYQHTYNSLHSESIQSYQKSYRSKPENQIKEKSRQKKRNLGFSIVHCRICAIEISSRGGRMYCDECKRKRNNAIRSAYQKRVRVPHPRIPKPKPDMTFFNFFRFQDKLFNSVRRKYYKKQQNKKYYKETPQGKLKRKLYKRIYESRASGVIHSFTGIEWNNKLQSTNGICPICQNNVGISNLTLDHIHPISKSVPGQIYTINDVQPLCRQCNSRKNNSI